MGELPGRRVVVDQVAVADRRPARRRRGSAVAAADRVARAAVVPDAVGRGARRARDRRCRSGTCSWRRRRGRRGPVPSGSVRPPGRRRCRPRGRPSCCGRRCTSRRDSRSSGSCRPVERSAVVPWKRKPWTVPSPVLVAADQPDVAVAEVVGAVDARGRGARVVDRVARAADAGDRPVVQQPVGARRPGDEVLAARVGVADALPGRDRLHAHAGGVAVGRASAYSISLCFTGISACIESLSREHYNYACS